MTDVRHISAEDLALHAMQALSIEEAAAVRAHLEQCGSCRAELASLNGDLALVSLGVDQQPLPAGARDRFFAKLTAASVANARSDSPQVIPIATRRRGPEFRWIPWMAVAALLILSVSLGFQVSRLKAALQEENRTWAQLAAASSEAQQVLDVLSAPAAQRVVLTAPAPPPPTPTGRAVYLPSRGGLIFQGNNLARLDEDKTYELWVIPASGAAPIPAGLFRPDAAGNATVVLPPLPVGVPAKAFGVTIEKAGGSSTPTAPIIISGAASASGE